VIGDLLPFFCLCPGLFSFDGTSRLSFCVVVSSCSHGHPFSLFSSAPRAHAFFLHGPSVVTIALLSVSRAPRTDSFKISRLCGPSFLRSAASRSRCMPLIFPLILSIEFVPLYPLHPPVPAPLFHVVALLLYSYPPASVHLVPAGDPDLAHVLFVARQATSLFFWPTSIGVGLPPFPAPFSSPYLFQVDLPVHGAARGPRLSPHIPAISMHLQRAHVPCSPPSFPEPLSTPDSPSLSLCVLFFFNYPLFE